MDALEKALISHNIQRIYLQTGETAPAKLFYEKLGFNKISLVSMPKTLS
jgi:ribosomal protein S18 acetylase RimI-like enzyme